MDAGIKVVLLAATIDGDSYDSLVTVDERDFGATGAEWLVEQIGGEGDIILLNGISGFSSNTLRYEGAMSVFDQYPDINILAAEDADWGLCDSQDRYFRPAGYLSGNRRRLVSGRCYDTGRY